MFLDGHCIYIITHRTLHRHCYTRHCTQMVIYGHCTPYIHGHTSDTIQTWSYTDSVHLETWLCIGHCTDIVIHWTPFRQGNTSDTVQYRHGYKSDAVHTWLYIKHCTDLVIQYIGHCYTELVIHRTLYRHGYTSDTVHT